MTLDSASRWTARLLASAALTVAVSLIYHFVVQVNATTVALSFLLVVLAIATAWGLVDALFASILSVLEFNYFFLPPVRTLTISDPENWIALIAFFVTAVTASQLSARAKRRTAEAVERRLETERLYALGQSMLLSSGVDPTARETVNRLMQIFDIPSAALYLRKEDAFFRLGPDAPALSDTNLRDVADHREPEIFLHQQIATVPVRLGGQTLGSLGFAGRTMSSAALNAVAYLVAIGVERARSLEETSHLEAARKSEVLKSALLDALAHDFKTPLTSIKGALTHLLSKKHEPEEEELLALANEETDRLNRLVVEVIEMARIESGKLHPERHPHRVADVVFGALKELEVSLKERDVRMEVPADLPAAEIDADFVQQAIKQLLDNAMKYSPPGSPIVVSAEFKGDKIVVHVADRGLGIDEQEQVRVFEKFFRGKDWRNEVPGTGLGLSIAKGIVEAHGGRIWVESQPGAGSVFTFSLPASKSESMP